MSLALLIWRVREKPEEFEERYDCEQEKVWRTSLRERERGEKKSNDIST